MRLVGTLLALAAIGWVIFQASGGGGGKGAVPEGYQQSLEKAEAIEQTVQDAAQESLQQLEDQNRQ